MSLNDLARSLRKEEILLPLLKQHLAKEEADERAGRIRNRDIVIDLAQMTIDALEKRKAEYNHRQQLDGQYYHPSALGVCLRKMFFGAKSAPTNGDPTGTDLLRSYMILEIGTQMHVIIQNLLERAGILVDREAAIMSAKKRIIGHADGILRINGKKYLFEFKTVNAGGYGRMREVSEAHKKQVHAYMHMLNIDACIVLYGNKDTGQLKEFLIMYDHSYYLKEVRNRIAKFFNRVEANEVPRKESEDPRGFPCSYCEYSNLCWGTENLKSWMKKTKATFPKKKNETAPKKKKLYS